MNKIIGINYLCVYAMLEMILKDIGEIKWDQIRLANRLGVTLLKGDSINGVDNVTYCTDEHKCGTHIDIEKLNLFFREESILLKASYLEANPYDYYAEAEEDNPSKYIVYLYSYGSLNNDPNKTNIGHASIRVGNIKNGMVSIYDPGPLNAGVKEVRLNRLYDAIGDYIGGILILERISSNE